MMVFLYLVHKQTDLLNALNPQSTTGVSKDVYNVKHSTLSFALLSVSLEFVVISLLPLIVQTDRSYGLEPQNN